MSQTISHTLSKKISKNEALRVARNTGASRGIIMGVVVILSILPSMWIVANIVKASYWSDNLVSAELMLLFLTMGLWFFIAALCGWRTAKRTGQGAEIGASSGFFFGFTSVVSAAATVLLVQFLLSALASSGPILDPVAIEPLLAIAAITTVLAGIAGGIGALLGALGVALLASTK